MSGWFKKLMKRYLISDRFRIVRWKQKMSVCPSKRKFEAKKYLNIPTIIY